ncbi:MAG TPA: hypothetical protein DEA89_03105, partial [Candidatus Moranbacteria bacterium]
SDAKENVKVVGSNGFFFKAKSVLNLRDRLAYLLSRSEEVSVMSDRSKKRAQKYLEKKAVLNNKAVVEKEIILEKNIWKWKNLLKKN